MTEDHVIGDVEKGAGKAEAIVGEVLDDPELELHGEAHQVEGSVQALIGQIQDGICDAADQISDAAIRAGETVRTVYADVNVRVQDAASRIDPFVKAKPYTALGIAAAGGLLLGMLYAGRGPKVVLIKTPPHH